MGGNVAAGAIFKFEEGKIDVRNMRWGQNCVYGREKQQRIGGGFENHKAMHKWEEAKGRWTR
jgi:hypothetical protein